MGYEQEIRAKAEASGIKQNIYDWYRNQTWLQEIALTYDASSHGGDKYEKVKRPYGIVHDVVNDMIFWTDAGTGHVVRSDVHGMHGAETPKAYMCDLGVPSCGGAFAPSTRLVSIRRGRGWFLFRF